MNNAQPEAVGESDSHRELDRLMALYQLADSTAAGMLIDKVSPLLFRFFLRQPSEREEAADLLQETWLRVHRVRHTYRSGEPVLPWLYAIARHVRVDAYRRRQRISWREQAMDRLPEPPVPSASATSSLPSFDVLIAALPEPQREVVTMLKVAGMSLEEVARATASSVGAVKQKAHRAYQKLRQILERTSKAGQGPVAL
ncbi:MAG: RNA polymerase sigma factor [Bryobacteraceae bacterium]